MKRVTLVPVLALAGFLAGCQGPCSKIEAINGPTPSGAVDFTTIAAVGTSISAGYQSGGLVDRHQVHAFPAILAAHEGRSVPVSGTGDFTFESCSNDGFPLPLLAITSYQPLIITNAGRVPGAPTNLSQPTDFHNLAVPGALMVDLVDSTYYTVDPNPVRGSGYNPIFFNVIWRHRGLGIEQLVRRNPTFITFEFGANEVLGAAVAGTSTLIFPPASYAAALHNALDYVHALLPGAKIAIANVPDVTEIPFVTTFPPFTLDLATGGPVPLIGPGGVPLAVNEHVLLSAQDSLIVGTGFPVGSFNYLGGLPGNGRPLLDQQVLSANELTAISGAVANMNATIAAEAAARPYVALVDMNGLLLTAATTGLRIGQTVYTSEFVTGGLFSLDGVHPNDLAQALIANTLIDAINAKFGASVAHVNPLDYASLDASSLAPGLDPEAARRPRIEGLPDALRLLFPARR